MKAGRTLLTRFLGQRLTDRLLAHPMDRQRVVRLAKAAVAAIAGRRVHCAHCNGRIGRVLPVVRRGRVEVWGIHLALVRVDFEDRGTLRFRHIAAENCPALRDDAHRT